MISVKLVTLFLYGSNMNIINYEEKRIQEQKKIDYILKNRQVEVEQIYYQDIYYKENVLDIKQKNDSPIILKG